MTRWQGMLTKKDEYRWEIPQDYKPGMRVPGLIYATDLMLDSIRDEQTPEQVANVACLPGIVNYSMAMPDIHWGYGFPIGGVAAMNTADGVVSPGGVGYDINCGVRLLRTSLSDEEIRGRIRELVGELYTNIPSGLGSEGKVRISAGEMERVMLQGAKWAVGRGLGQEDDLEVTEEGGCLSGADPDKTSAKAAKRGMPQAGTLGSGNHFIEVQRVAEIFDSATAAILGIREVGQVLVLIHTGSRGFGHQVCTDHLRVMEAAASKYGIPLPDRQLACAPIASPEGRDYLSAMACAANYAWANRQCIAHWTREAFSKVFGKSSDELGMKQVYDVAHNIAKIEKHTVGGRLLEAVPSPGLERESGSFAWIHAIDILSGRQRGTSRGTQLSSGQSAHAVDGDGARAVARGQETAGGCPGRRRRLSVRRDRVVGLDRGRLAVASASVLRGWRTGVPRAGQEGDDPVMGLARPGLWRYRPHATPCRLNA